MEVENGCVWNAATIGGPTCHVPDCGRKSSSGSMHEDTRDQLQKSAKVWVWVIGWPFIIIDVHSFVISFIHSEWTFVHLLICSLIQSVIHSSNQSFHSFIISFICSWTISALYKALFKTICINRYTVYQTKSAHLLYFTYICITLSHITHYRRHIVCSLYIFVTHALGPNPGHHSPLFPETSFTGDLGEVEMCNWDRFQQIIGIQKQKKDSWNHHLLDQLMVKCWSLLLFFFGKSHISFLYLKSLFAEFWMWGNFSKGWNSNCLSPTLNVFDRPPISICTKQKSKQKVKMVHWYLHPQKFNNSPHEEW